MALLPSHLLRGQGSGNLEDSRGPLIEAIGNCIHDACVPRVLGEVERGDVSDQGRKTNVYTAYLEDESQEADPHMDKRSMSLVPCPPRAERVAEAPITT